MNDFGLFHRKTFNFDYPIELSKCMDKYFLRGYIDGDGCVGVYKVGGTKNLLVISIICDENFSKSLFNKFPINPKIALHSCKTMWDCRWNGENAVQIGRWLYENNEIIESRKMKIFSAYEKSYISKLDNRNVKIQKLLCYLEQGYSMEKSTKMLGVAFQTGYKWKSKGWL